MYFGESVENDFTYSYLNGFHYNLIGLDNREFINESKHMKDILNYIKNYYNRYNIPDNLINKYFKVYNITQYSNYNGFELNVYCEWDDKIFVELKKQGKTIPNRDFNFRIEYEEYEKGNETRYRFVRNDF